MTIRARLRYSIVLMFAASLFQVGASPPSVDYIETIKQLYLIDVKTGEALDRHQLKRKHDYVSFHRSSVDGYVAMQHEYDRFNTVSIGYEGVFFLSEEEFALDAPAFHFYRRIGSQDMPYAELRELEAGSGTVYRAGMVSRLRGNQ